MNIVIQSADTASSDQGLHYFLSLFGFPAGSAGSRIPVRRTRPETPMVVDHQIHGWITWKGAKVPVFQRPADLSNQGEVVLTYTDGTASYPCAVIRHGDIIISLDIFSHLGLITGGYMEEILVNLKEGKKEIVALPFIDYYCDFLFSCIRIAGKTTKTPVVHKAFWPEGKTCAVCLTHDVDGVKKTYQWISYPLKLIRQGNFGGLVSQFYSFIDKLKGHEPYWTFDEITRIEGERGVTSSFYFLKETGEVLLSDRKTWRHAGRRYNFNDKNVRDLLLTLHSGGWEVGLHGSFYSYLDLEKLKSEKAALEYALGSPVIGGRQHNLNLKIPDTWLNQEKAGLSYDTTLGFNDCLGFRWGISFPFRPWYAGENRNLAVLQIPLAIEDLPYFRNPQPWNAFLRIFNHVELSHGVVTLLWHHSVFNEHEFPGWAADYIKILDYARKRNAWIGSAHQICEWWNRREKTTLVWNYEGTLLKIFPHPEEEQHYFSIHFPESMKINEVRKATIIGCDQESCEIKTTVMEKGECVEIVFTET